MSNIKCQLPVNFESTPRPSRDHLATIVNIAEQYVTCEERQFRYLSFQFSPSLI